MIELFALTATLFVLSNSPSTDVFKAPETTEVRICMQNTSNAKGSTHGRYLLAQASTLAHGVTVRIVNPQNGTTVRPGEEIEFNIEVIGASKGSILIVGHDYTKKIEGPPYSTKVRIPKSAKGQVRFMAAFKTPSNQHANSKSVILNVDPQ